MAAEAYGVDIRARLQGGQEVRSEAQGIAGAFRHVGSEVRTSGEHSLHAGHSYEYATQRLHLFGNAAVGMRERTLGLASAALGVTGAMFGVEEIVRKSTDAWAEQRRTTAQTGAVLKSTGGAAHVTAVEVQSLAEQISRTTGVQADQIQQAENMTLSFRNIRDAAGAGNDIFTQSTRAAVDMSAAFTSAGKSMSISDAALQLGKALNDPEKGMARLQRIGVTFTQGQVDQAKALQASGDRMGAQRIILSELTKEFGGSAAAVATPGAKLRATVHQLEEEFGRGLQPAIDSVDQGLMHLADKAMPAVSRFSDDLSKAFDAKGLSLGERLSMVGTDAKVDLGPFVHQLGVGLRRAHLGDELEQAVEWAAPKMAEGAAHAAPHVISAFASAWWHTDIWGKLLIGGVALKRLGLLGTVAGRVFGTSFAASAAEGEAAGSLLGGGGAAAGAAGRAGMLGRMAPLLGLEALGAPEIAAGLAAFGTGYLGVHTLGHAFGIDKHFQDEAARKQHAEGVRRLQAMGKVHIRYANGADAWESPQGAAMEVHLHHATYLDGKVIARSVTKHATDARARKSG